MSVKIKKWGNSLGVRIPKAVIEKVNLSENSEVEIESKNGTIIIFPAKKEYSLDTLLDQITKTNLHSEEDFKSEGNEVW
ncbi:MAG: AbrB/MazE/SpoVT family DNA-binding domain-containing protein [Bdellovibrionales bacterium CG10_big_fil_rev_8_21_14_0_10_45_34]|nr:MAG: AbrB/MazE/SpoVT family DNA-binding domain-containing protein [Bdellovibrionales bacterium CG10_big_fil_rev_8_21_14_0_10_45_34]